MDESPSVPAPIRAAVAGATGYAGQGLLRLLSRHPGVHLTAAMSSGDSGARRLPGLARIWTGAFRLRDASLRKRWYPETVALPTGTLYALPERSRTQLPAARLVSCPGCYPTASMLSLLPLADVGLLEGDVIIDAKSGISKIQVDGIRVTDQPTLDTVVPVLAGAINTRFVAAINAAGGQAVSLTGAGADGTLLNVNADTMAAALAVRLGASRLLIAGTTAGVLDGSGKTIAVLHEADERALAQLDAILTEGVQERAS